MLEVGLDLKHIYIEKQSGKDFNRPKYKSLVRHLRKDDVLFIKSIDRLGRNYEEILEQWRILTKSKEIDICVLDMPLLDTRQGKDLIGTFLSDVVLQLLSFVSETERDAIRQRQREGIRAAKEKGVVFGRPTTPLPENFEEVYMQFKKKEVNGLQAAQLLKMPESTFRYKIKRYEEEKSKNSQKGMICCGDKGGKEKILIILLGLFYLQYIISLCNN